VSPRVCAAIVLATLSACRGSVAPEAGGRELLLTGGKPDRLFVIDPAARAVVGDFHIPDANGFVGTIVPSPDGKLAYVLVNRMESIAGIDLQTGRQVFRAQLSSAGERVKSMFAFDVTPDGRELIVYENPTRMLPDEYVVEEPRFVVFNTADGLTAKPMRQFPAPRRVSTVLSKKDGSSFYAIGFELYEFDRQTGRLIGQRGIRDWNRPGYSIPDMLALWPVTEPTGIFSNPVYSQVSAPGTATGSVSKTSLMTLDLKTGRLEYRDFDDGSTLIFASSVSPVRPWAFGVYSQLTKIDLAHGSVAGRVDLDHTFYDVNLSADGRQVYLGGTMCDVAIYDAQTLKKASDIRLPGCPDQVVSTLRVIHR
jgi:quinohemoprotein amine dehydrogenase beta subunit